MIGKLIKVGILFLSIGGSVAKADPTITNLTLVSEKRIRG